MRQNNDFPSNPAIPAGDGGHAGHDHDHSGHDHSGQDHSGHDHAGHDHAGHGHAGHVHLPTGPDAGRRMLLACALTGGFLIAEVIGGVLSGSLALLADAAHMVTDVGALLLGYAGLRLAQRKADARRSFGYGRFEVLASFVNGIALLALSAWIIFEAAMRLFEPVQVLSSPMLVIAVLGLAVNVASFLLLRDGADNLNVRGALIHVIGDMLGSVATIAAALVIMLTGWMPIDPLLSALVAVLVIRSGWDITRRTAHILLEGTPEGIDVAAIGKDLCGLPEVAQIYHVHVWTLTTGKVMATLHVVPAAGVDYPTVTTIVRKRLHDAFGIDHTTIEIDPLALPDSRARPLETCAAH